MSLLSQSLEERRLPLGGWRYLHSSQTSVEFTSLAVMVLSESSDARESGLEQLLCLQRRDGGWPAFLGDSGASWTTALALCALNQMTDFASTREKGFHWLIAERGREAHWFWRWKFKTVDRSAQFDPDKYGWPWSPGTASWVIPTAFSIIVLKQFTACTRRSSVRESDPSGRRNASGSRLHGWGLECW